MDWRNVGLYNFSCYSRGLTRQQIIMRGKDNHCYYFSFLLKRSVCWKANSFRDPRFNIGKITCSKRDRTVGRPSLVGGDFCQRSTPTSNGQKKLAVKLRVQRILIIEYPNFSPRYRKSPFLSPIFVVQREVGGRLPKFVAGENVSRHA